MRWQVIAGREFPLNDGGYWYVFTKALIENHFALPEFVQFNGRALPTYYPPLAGYLLALISFLGNIEILTLLLWVPFILCLSMIAAFYTLTLKLYNEQLTPRFAILLFALSPLSYRWFLMGGGVARGLGIIFLMGALSLLLRKDDLKPKYILAGLFAGLAVLSHPVAALLVPVCTLILLFLGRISLETIFKFFLSAGVVATPWLALVISRTGLKPFLSALMSGDQGLAGFITAIATSQVYSSIGIFAAFALIGFCYGITQSKSFAAILFLVMALICPLFLSCGFGCIPLALMSAEGAGLIYKNLLQSRYLVSATTIILVFFSFIFIGFSESVSAARVIARQSMTNEEFREIRNLRLPDDAGQDVLVLTQYQVVGDAVGEWLTAFTGYRSVLTHQMGEWEGERNIALEQDKDLQSSEGGLKIVLNIIKVYPGLKYLIKLSKRSGEQVQEFDTKKQLTHPRSNFKIERILNDD